ncbi:unnamed protein product [Soboliphyme baturini]|uniref:CRISPR type III A-associated protein Csm2 n=1 Tax=Soboliphyme baturini TaxID=241478 RepID=A0A183IFW0_9BILA|nr:unnamed protein product [Soboliphyme baturini]
MDSVTSIIAALVKDNTITAAEASRYLEAIRQQLIAMHKHLLKDLKATPISREKPKTTIAETFNQMLIFTEVLLNGEQAKQNLFDSLKELYALYKQGNQQSYELLRRYISFIQVEGEANRISKEAQNIIYSFVVSAFKEVNNELELHKIHRA